MLYFNDKNKLYSNLDYFLNHVSYLQKITNREDTSCFNEEGRKDIHTTEQSLSFLPETKERNYNEEIYKRKIKISILLKEKNHQMFEPTLDLVNPRIFSKLQVRQGV